MADYVIRTKKDAQDLEDLLDLFGQVAAREYVEDPVESDRDFFNDMDKQISRNRLAKKLPDGVFNALDDAVAQYIGMNGDWREMDWFIAEFVDPAARFTLKDAMEILDDYVS